jgi:carbamoyltransferase
VFVLGLSASSHDPAAALLTEKGIVAAIEESKLVRSPSVAGIPRQAIQFCLEHAGIGWKDIHAVAIAGRPVRAWFRQSMFRARFTPLAPVSAGYYQSKALGELGRELNNIRILKLMKENSSGLVIRLDHQLCHAASAFYASPFEKSLIVSMDERGDGRSGLIAVGEGKHIRPMRWIPFPHSLAWVYSQVTEILGFEPHKDEHKTHWLSLAGLPEMQPLFLEMFRHGSSSNAYPHIDMRFFNRGLTGRVAFSKLFYRRLGISPGADSRVPESMRAQVAASLQSACAVVITDFLESLRKKTGLRQLCLAGGLFLNSVLVAAIEKSTGFDQIFVQPAAGNGGTAPGAAWHVWHEIFDNARLEPPTHLYLGPGYSNEEIKKVLDNCKASYRWMGSETEKLDETVRLLRSGKIVGWYQGPAEFGPRALGNRSLLASPWASYVKENLNDYIKHRESFRPFALSVPEEDYARFFECSFNGRFLATLGLVHAQFREMFKGFLLPSDRVRLHVVARDSNPLLWRLLKRFGEDSPAPVLVNTSFNLFGEPLVVTPRDAVRSYFCSGLDALVAGNFLLSKS